MTDELLPWEEFASRLDGPNVYPAPPSQLVPPAIVLRPSEPWIVPEGMGWDRENYVAVCVVSASDPASGLRALYELVRTVVNATDDAFSLGSVGSPVIDESTGTPVLAATVSITHRRPVVS